MIRQKCSHDHDSQGWRILNNVSSPVRGQEKYDECKLQNPAVRYFSDL